MNALTQADAATDDDAWGKALQALAGIGALVEEPHEALTQLIAKRLGAIDEPAGWAVEEIQEGEEPLAERITAMKALRKRLDVPVYKRSLPVLETIDAWLAEHAKATTKR